MTDLSQKSDEELSRAIAEHLEPSSSRGDAREYVLHWGIAKGTKCWRTMRTGVVADVADDTIHWWHRNMVNDPAMTVMLLEKLPPGHVIDIEDDGTVTIFRYEDVVPCGEGRLGRAVCEAYAQAHRLFEGEL